MRDKRRKRWSVLAGVLGAALLAVVLPVNAKAEEGKVALEVLKMGTVNGQGFEEYFTKDNLGSWRLKSEVASGSVLDFSGNFSYCFELNNVKKIYLDKQVTLKSSEKNAFLPQVRFYITDGATIEGLKLEFEENGLNEESSCLFDLVNNEYVAAVGDTGETELGEMLMPTVVIKDCDIDYKTNSSTNCYVVRTNGVVLMMSGNKVTYTGNTNGHVYNKVLYVRRGYLEAKDNTFTISSPVALTDENWEAINPGDYDTGVITEAFQFQGEGIAFEKNKVDVTITGVAESGSEEGLEAQGEGKFIAYYEPAGEYRVLDIMIEKDDLFRSGNQSAEEERSYNHDVTVVDNEITVKNGVGRVGAIDVVASSYKVSGNKISLDVDGIGKGIETLNMDYFSKMFVDVSANVGDVDGSDVAETENAVCELNQNVIDLNAPIGFAIRSKDIKERKAVTECDITKNEITAKGICVGGIIAETTAEFANAIKENTIDVSSVNGAFDFMALINMGLPPVPYGIELYCESEEDVPSSILEGNQITTNQGAGLAVYAPATITKNNIRSGGTFSIEAYKEVAQVIAKPVEKPVEGTEESGEEAIILVTITKNTLASKDKKGDASVLYDDTKVQVSDNGDYVDPNVKEPTPEDLKPGIPDPEDVREVVKPAEPEKIDTRAEVKLTAKGKKFKAKTKIKKYSVTLKCKKKAIKKAKVTLMVNGKTYSAKTNKKGKATFKIKKLFKKGKYSATVAFAGNDKYKEATKNVKIIVK